MTCAPCRYTLPLKGCACLSARATRIQQLDLLTSLDRANGDQERYGETLPKGEEEDSLDTQKLGWKQPH
jgi:hypothetical protein